MNRAAKLLKATVASLMISATAIALLSFVLFRIGAGSFAASLLSDNYTAAFLGLSIVLLPLLYVKGR